MSVEQLAVEAPISAARLTANTIKDIWSVMDAAAEKPAPTQYLGAKAIQAIQGVTNQAQKAANAAVSAAS
jgi:hypothetical protein